MQLFSFIKFFNLKLMFDFEILIFLYLPFGPKAEIPVQTARRPGRSCWPCRGPPMHGGQRKGNAAERRGLETNGKQAEFSPIQLKMVIILERAAYPFGF